MWPAERAYAQLLLYRGLNDDEAQAEILKKLKEKWSQLDSKSVRRISAHTETGLVAHFKSNKKEITICEKDYFAASFSAKEMLDLVSKGDETNKSKDGYVNFLEDYKEDGSNPWQGVYEPNGRLRSCEYAAHRDQSEESHTLIWTACAPSNHPRCGTAICKKDIDAKHDAENVCAMTQEDMEHVPPECLILIKLDQVPHAPPTLEDLQTKFSERIFLTVYVDAENVDKDAEDDVDKVSKKAKLEGPAYSAQPS